MWGLAWVPLRTLHDIGIDGVPLTLIAFGTAGAALLPFLLRQRAQWRGDGRWLLVIALLGGYANLSFTTAMVYGDVVRVMVLFYLLPVWGVVGGRLFLGERIDTPRIACVIAALTGAGLILGAEALLTLRVHWTDLLAISCGLAFTGNNLVFRARQGAPVTSKAAAMLLGAAALAALALLFHAQPLTPLSVPVVAGAAGYGLWVLLATIGMQFGVTHMAAGRASVLIILELIVAVLSAVLLGEDELGAREWTGVALVMLAAIAEARRAT
jgi:drug/metabolite transporter (DMT)-like permease